MLTCKLKVGLLNLFLANQANNILHLVFEETVVKALGAALNSSSGYMWPPCRILPTSDGDNKFDLTCQKILIAVILFLFLLGTSEATGESGNFPPVVRNQSYGR